MSITSKKLPKHLGGHFNITHTDKGALDWACSKFGIRSMVDIGCGPAGMMKIALDRAVDWRGVDGDFTLTHNRRVIINDYTKTSALKDTYDLSWSVEFLEHIEPRYQDNYMADFKKSKFAIVTHAPLGKKGHHHVNCQTSDYWKSVFRKHGFIFDVLNTEELRYNSSMNRNFMRRNGLFFINENIGNQ